MNDIINVTVLEILGGLTNPDAPVIWTQGDVMHFWHPLRSDKPSWHSIPSSCRARACLLVTPSLPGLLACMARLVGLNPNLGVSIELYNPAQWRPVNELARQAPPITTLTLRGGSRFVTFASGPSESHHETVPTLAGIADPIRAAAEVAVWLARLRRLALTIGIIAVQPLRLHREQLGGDQQVWVLSSSAQALAHCPLPQAGDTDDPVAALAAMEAHRNLPPLTVETA